VKVAVIGSGYVGLVSGTCFAEFGAHVTCIDVDEAKVRKLSRGETTIYEPGLDTLLKGNISAGRLQFTTSFSAVSGADLVFIAVGTPSRRGDGYADLSYVYAAAREIARHLDGYTVIIDKSTVPVGTARQVERIVRQENTDAEFDVASNPEFLREGSAIEDFMRPDRVVLGVESPRAESLLRELYRPLMEAPVLVTGLESAELIKYASNAFLATKISFINDLSALCEAVGADVQTIAKGMGMDRRIGEAFLHAGPGYGGSCLPKDTKALVRTAQEHGLSCRIVEAAIEINDAQKARMVHKIRSALGGSEMGKTIAVLGLTFKPETDDMRDAPSLTILPNLLEKGARIRAHDPQGVREAKKLLPDGIAYCQEVYETFDGADAVVLLTEWNLYRGLDLDRIRERMCGNLFIDLRNIYNKNQMHRAGFKYVCIGRPAG